MFIDLADGHSLSIAAPENSWHYDPEVASFARLFDVFAAGMGMPTTEIRSDGKTKWEVASFYKATHDGIVVPEWQEYLMEEAFLSEEWQLYGNVPTQVVVDYVTANGGDPTEFLAWVEARTGAETEAPR